MITVLENTRRFGVYTTVGPGDNKRLEVAKPKATDVKQKPDAAKLSAAANLAPAVDLEQLILSTLASGNDIADSWIFAESNNVDHQNLIGALKSLLVDAYAADVPITSSFWVLTDEGSEIVTKGSPEFQVYQAVPAEGISVVELNTTMGEIGKIGLGPCMKNKWLKKDGDRIIRIMERVKDDTAISLADLASPTAASKPSEDDLKNLKRRKLVNQIVRKSYRISKGVEFQPTRVRKLADLTKEMLGVASDVSTVSIEVNWTAKLVNCKHFELSLNMQL